jgi:hypothetical protein
MRKEVQLSENIISFLQKGATKKKWSLKKYMEQILINHAVKIGLASSINKKQQTEKVPVHK